MIKPGCYITPTRFKSLRHMFWPSWAISPLQVVGVRCKALGDFVRTDTPPKWSALSTSPGWLWWNRSPHPKWSRSGVSPGWPWENRYPTQVVGAKCKPWITLLKQIPLNRSFLAKEIFLKCNNAATLYRNTHITSAIWPLHCVIIFTYWGRARLL